MFSQYHLDRLACDLISGPLDNLLKTQAEESMFPNALEHYMKALVSAENDAVLLLDTIMSNTNLISARARECSTVLASALDNACHDIFNLNEVNRDLFTGNAQVIFDKMLQSCNGDTGSLRTGLMSAARQLPKSGIWDTITANVSDGQRLGILFGEDGNSPDIIISEVNEGPFKFTDLKVGDRIKIINGSLYTLYTKGVQMRKSAVAEGTVKITVMHPHH